MSRLFMTKFAVLVVVIYVVVTFLPLLFGTTKAGDQSEHSSEAPVASEAIQPDFTLLPNRGVNNTNLAILHQIVTDMNAQQVVHHVDRFGPLGPGDPVLVVQVHNRWRYLLHLLSSLARVEGIGKALIIFSHDYYDHHLPSLPSSVTFCKVMQIFFENSTQLYPFQFPGQDPRDCPRDTKPDYARKIKCLNADHPDVYMHYRESKFTQIKHHWWWKVNTVFHKLNITKNHDGPMLLLEEDHYVTPDLLVMAKLMLSEKNRFCKNATCLCSVGNSKVDHDHHPQTADKVEILKWAQSSNNLGHLFTRDVWNVVKSCAHEFCTYDDYNWDLTLTALAKTCFPRNSLQVSLRNSRVLHIGDCGVHSKSRTCREDLVKRAFRIAAMNRSFRRATRLMEIPPRHYKVPLVSGGWGDIRDHNLCLSMTTQ
ncbi:alpha-1,6-mannosyl-glycoprotein 2-beta-N-acetylglucosaminyltransferase-like isoform X2 [Ornithodoros turicata]|uniref:alpha-1,6-mannosyl-glycoprotein 2-beta-N-acetylglucosaminyltransferase-like isoform X2 n=1 Tax=Ornithodoros turicata TaxID=34597 RepID=UPI003138F2D5